MLLAIFFWNVVYGKEQNGGHAVIVLLEKKAGVELFVTNFEFLQIFHYWKKIRIKKSK